MNKDGKNRLMAGLVTLVLLFSMITLMTNTVSAALLEGIETSSGMCGQKIWINTSGWNGGATEYVEIFS